jgi:hypothetical protein
LGVLFFFPIPLFFVRFAMKFVKIDKFSDDIPLDKKELVDLITHKGININVRSHSGEKVIIKTI